MSFWQIMLMLVGTVWVFMLVLGTIGAGLPVLRDKIRKRRSEK